MKPTPEVLIGSPLVGSEADLLVRLTADLSSVPALILANFEVSLAHKTRQIDFVVVTETHAQLLEQKTFHGPIVGSENGSWKLTDGSGGLVVYAGENPWVQASQAKYLLSDLMADFARNASGAPAPINKKFYREFDASVCIYPHLDARSRVTKGNSRAYVRSYSDCLSEIRYRPIKSNWRISEWRRFGLEGLGLRQVDLKQAIDAKVLAASDLLNDYRKQLLVALANNPPLGPTGDDQFGEQLVEKLSAMESVLLLGPKGCGKSFHLKHLLRRLASTSDIPVFVQAKHYTGAGITDMICRGIAPYFRGSAPDFPSDCDLVGSRIALIVDGINECSTDLMEGLFDELKAFVMRSRGHLVASSHDTDKVPAGLFSASLTMKPLTSAQKRSIYSHYAGNEHVAERLYAGFTNAYDLKVAGQCHQGLNVFPSRAELYDLYCRRNLSAAYEAVSLGFLRTLASVLQNSFSFSMSREAFDRTAESYLGDHAEGLQVVDSLRQSRLLEITNDRVSFEHEILFIYFRAEFLRREVRDLDELESQISRPLHQELIELVLPRFSNASEIARLIRCCAQSSIVETALRGGCGDEVRATVEKECRSVIDLAIADLQNITLVVTDGTRQNGTIFVSSVQVEGARVWSSFELLLFDVLWQTFPTNSWTEQLVALFFFTEERLKEIASTRAKEGRLKFRAVWRETVRCLGMLSPSSGLPAQAALHLARIHQLFDSDPKRGQSILDSIFAKLQTDPLREFSLLLSIYGNLELCHLHQPVDINRCIELLRISFTHASSLTRMDVLTLFRVLEWHNVRDDIEMRAKIGRELQKLDTNDLFVNNQLFEMMTAYGVMEPIRPVEDAEEEFRRLVRPTPEFVRELNEQLALRPELSRDELIAEYAYSAVSNIFEDVFAGTYSEAYESLTSDEKIEVLCLAASRKESDGLSLNWILAELSRASDVRSAPIFAKFATRIVKDVFVYESASNFLIAIVSCAKFLDRPPDFQDAISQNETAWSLVGQILFWHSRMATDPSSAKEQIECLWKEAKLVAPSLPDVLRHLSNGMFRELLESFPNLVELHQEEVRSVFEEAVSKRSEISSLISGSRFVDQDLLLYTVGMLGAIGDESSAIVLQTLVEDRSIGPTAIKAIFDIRRAGKARTKL